jgi:cation:H+ antiporter
MLGTAGYAVAESGIAIAEMTGLSETAVGGIFTAVSTSLPELVTSIAAVQQGALTLAIGDIIGGNSFDVLFLAFADIAYREGSIYHAIASQQAFLSVLAILMTGILLLGLLRREKYGLANIGLESVLILLLYFGGFVIVFLQSQP